MMVLLCFSLIEHFDLGSVFAQTVPKLLHLRKCIQNGPIQQTFQPSSLCPSLKARHEGEYILVVVAFGYIWVLLGTFGYIWVLLGTFGYFWVLLGTFGYLRVIACIFRHLRVTLGNLRYLEVLLCNLLVTFIRIY